MSIGLWTVVFVGGSFALYLTIAWLARVRDTLEPPPAARWLCRRRSP